MAVKVESAGSHAFDLDHIRRQGGEELIARLLAEANLSPDLPWRVQVQKKLNCNSETPPIRVVAAPKKWAVYLKIKPGDNNSCHFCSLLMPPGLQGEEVYTALRDATLELDRNWRIKSVEECESPQPEASPDENNHVVTAATEEPPPTAAAPEPPPVRPIAPPVATARPPEPPEPAKPAEKPAPVSGKGWLSDPDKLRLLLHAIRELDKEGPYPQNRFSELLALRLGWTGATAYQVGGMFTALVRKDLIVRKFRGSQPFGYELSKEGHQLLEELTPPAPPAPPPAAAAAPGADPYQLIRTLSSVAQRFIDANARLEEITARETELRDELEFLRSERADICSFLDDPEVRKVLSGLSQMNPFKG
jgi:hypothetical protein